MKKFILLGFLLAAFTVASGEKPDPKDRGEKLVEQTERNMRHKLDQTAETMFHRLDQTEDPVKEERIETKSINKINDTFFKAVDKGERIETKYELDENGDD